MLCLVLLGAGVTARWVPTGLLPLGRVLCADSAHRASFAAAAPACALAGVRAAGVAGTWFSFAELQDWEKCHEQLNLGECICPDKQAEAAL